MGEMPTRNLKLSALPGSYAVCHLDADAPVPEWALTGPFASATRCPDELSVVCLETLVPEAVERYPGWRCLRVDGPLEISLTGILCSLADPLARAGISIFVISSYQTDYLMVREEMMPQAIQVLSKAGHEIAS